MRVSRSTSHLLVADPRTLFDKDLDVSNYDPAVNDIPYMEDFGYQMDYFGEEDMHQRGPEDEASSERGSVSFTPSYLWFELKSY